MKRILLIFLIVLLSNSATAQDSWLVQKFQGAKGALVGDDAKSNVQADEKNTTDEERATWEVAIKMPAFVKPDSGDRQMSLAISDVWVYHNMSKGFLSFWGMTKMLNDIKKTQKEGSFYSDSWDYRLIGAGVQWYLTKQNNYNIALFFGGARIIANDDDDNKPELGIAEISGIKLDIPYKKDDPFGWNIEISYEDIIVENKEMDIDKSLGDSGMQSWMIGIRIPL